MTITEVSEKYNIPQDMLRYYERVGMIPRVNRNKDRIRDYTDQDCMWVEFVRSYLSAGLPIEILIEYVGLFQQGDATIETRMALFIEQRELFLARMEEIRKRLERLDYKISA